MKEDRIVQVFYGKNGIGIEKKLVKLQDQQRYLNIEMSYKFKDNVLFSILIQYRIGRMNNLRKILFIFEDFFSNFFRDVILILIKLNNMNLET